MVFSSMIFLWVFLPLLIVMNFLLVVANRGGASNVLLLIASLVFYAWGEPVYVLLMISSIVVNWLLGALIGSTERPGLRKGLLAITILLNLSSLGYFKYWGMLSDLAANLTGLEISAKHSVALPIGISFYTFQAMSYVIDVYRRDCPYQKNPLKVGLYIALFPQLIAGPILKYKDVSAQIEHRELTLDKMTEGVRRFAYGLGKKVLIANVLAYAVDKLYALEMSQVTWIMAWSAAIMYTFQIYYDFSGYSDMAIGLGKMFGFDFKENFIYPYTSLSIREFWTRWHISLGSWFREYVYIPLGGNRHGKRLTYENLFIVFFLTGLWHGASGSFVLWGLYHGFFSILERMRMGEFLKKHRGVGWVYTFLVVVFGWVLFRVEALGPALEYMRRMIMPWTCTVSAYALQEFVSVKALVMLALGFAGSLLPRWISDTTLSGRLRNSVAEYLYLTAIFALCILSLASSTYNPFIYFRF